MPGDPAPSPRIPKLTFRNQRRDTSTERPASPLKTFSTKPREDELNSQGSPRSLSLVFSRDSFRSNSTRSLSHDFRPSSSWSQASSTDQMNPQPKKKSWSMLDFVKLKEPSSAALAQFAESQRRQAAEKSGARSMPVGIPGITNQKLPPEVPKVNSKWDGLPRPASKDARSHGRKSSSAADDRSMMTGTFSRSSMSTSLSGSSHSGPQMSSQMRKPSQAAVAPWLDMPDATKGKRKDAAATRGPSHASKSPSLNSLPEMTSFFPVDAPASPELKTSTVDPDTPPTASPPTPLDISISNDLSTELLATIISPSHSPQMLSEPLPKANTSRPLGLEIRHVPVERGPSASTATPPMTPAMTTNAGLSPQSTPEAATVSAKKRSPRTMPTFQLFPPQGSPGRLPSLESPKSPVRPAALDSPRSPTFRIFSPDSPKFKPELANISRKQQAATKMLNPIAPITVPDPRRTSLFAKDAPCTPGSYFEVEGSPGRSPSVATSTSRLSLLSAPSSYQGNFVDSPLPPSPLMSQSTNSSTTSEAQSLTSDTQASTTSSEVVVSNYPSGFLAGEAKELQLSDSSEDGEADKVPGLLHSRGRTTRSPPMVTSSDMALLTGYTPNAGTQPAKGRAPSRPLIEGTKFPAPPKGLPNFSRPMSVSEGRGGHSRNDSQGAASIAPSELSVQWKRSPKERLGLGAWIKRGEQTTPWEDKENAEKRISDEMEQDRRASRRPIPTKA